MMGRQAGAPPRSTPAVLLPGLEWSVTEPPAAARGKATEWLESARGSVILAPGETLDDLRMSYHGPKYGINS